MHERVKPVTFNNMSCFEGLIYFVIPKNSQVPFYKKFKTVECM